MSFFPIHVFPLGTASNAVMQLSDVEIVDAVPKDDPAELEVLLTERARSSASFLEEGCVETVNLAACDADGNEYKGDPYLIQKLSLDSYTIQETVAQPGSITKMP